MEQGATQTEMPKCKMCKTFFAHSQFSGHCSKCYQESHAKETAVERKETVDEVKPAQPQEEKPKIVEKPEQKDRKRCFNCRKKTGLLGIECKCGYVYCNSHRLPEDHSCQYDHKADLDARLRQKLNKVCQGKIEKF